MVEHQVQSPSLLVNLAVLVVVLAVQVAVRFKQAVQQPHQVKAMLVEIQPQQDYLAQVVVVQLLQELMPHQQPQATAVMVQVLIHLGVLQLELVRTLQELFGMQAVAVVVETVQEQAH